MTFDVRAAVKVYQRYGWQNYFEAFAICRKCHVSTVFVVAHTVEGRKILNGSDLTEDIIVKDKLALNDLCKIEGYVSQKDIINRRPDPLLPADIADAFREGATCMSVECYYAAATMFRLCVDLATRPLLPDPADSFRPQPNSRQRRDLGLRLQWLFDNNCLDLSLRELAACVREDANDGAHAGNLGKDESEDLIDFTEHLLDRVIVQPMRVREAEARRQARRQAKP